MRFVNDSRQSGVKTGKEKELRKLLAGGKLASAKPSAGTAASDGMVLWVTDSKSSPPVRAITSVIMATGEVQSRVSITDETTAEDVLKVRLARVRRSGKRSGSGSAEAQPDAHLGVLLACLRPPAHTLAAQLHAL